jgi:ABC-type amino acid transport substrate-binding protein
MNLLRTAAAFLIAGLSIGAAEEALSRPLDDVLASKTLRVVAYIDNEPFSWEEGEAVKGIDVDLARAIARELGVEAEIILRMSAEKSDQDVRVNVWRGTVGGGTVGDILMHVPVDGEFALRFKEAVIGNAYFQQRVAMAIHPEIIGDNPDFSIFRKHKVGVQIGTVADYFIMTYEDGALIENVAHHVRVEAGVKEFLGKETAAILGVRSKFEGLLHRLNFKPVITEPLMPDIVRSNWVVGMAWKEDSRDLGYAVQAALEKIMASGEMQRIFASYGVTYYPPPTP